MRCHGLNHVGRALALAVLAIGLSAPAAGEPDPEALAKLRAATDYLTSLERFSVDGQAALEVVLQSGQKLQFDNSVELVVERPNKLRATRKGEIADQVFYYDGKSLTLFNPERNLYGVKAAPSTLDAMLDFARDELDIVAPAADLVYADAYDALAADMTAGFIVSDKSLLHGESCTHLAFRKPGVDIQIWIRNGDRPLPLKYVLTTTDMLANPQYVLTLSNWNTKPRTTGKTFRFDPPAGAKQIDFLPLAPAAQ